MRRLNLGRAAAVVLLPVLLMSTPAHALPVLSFELPASYTPGTPFEVDLLLTGASDLGSFDITVILASTAGTTGADFFFTNATEPASDYVFGGDGLGLLFDIPAGAQNTIQLGDVLLVGTGVSTVAGVNDRVATLTVQTTLQAGTLDFSIDTDFLFLDTLNAMGASVGAIPDFESVLDLPPTGSIRQEMNGDPSTIIPTPAASAALIGFGLLSLRRQRRHNRG